MGRPTTSHELESEIAALVGLSRSELAERWRKLCRADPPKGLSRRLLARGIAYEMQAKCYDGLKQATVRRLLAIAGGAGSDDHARRAATAAPRTGARLVREWNGVSHVVDVLEDGYVWNGERHRSLSAIARAITGARWSGPRFFGLSARDAS